MDKDLELMKKAYDRIEHKKQLVKSDYYRLEYHLMSPVGFINDPNGFINIKGEYHMFYQFNPFYPDYKLTYWGHFKSKDLVNWEEMPIALAPSNWYETHGCYSGSAVDNNGVFTLIYTGNVKDKNGNRETYQCLAISKNGVDFKKYENNPVIYNQPEGYTRHFRDPKVSKKDGIWYMVIGTQTIKEEGRVLLFKSENLNKWSIVGEVAGSNLDNLGYFGYMFECPDLFELVDKDVLIACPQGVESQGDLYNNIYQAGYFIGKLDYNTGKLKHNGFTEIDRGFEFYAPQTTVDEKGRRILVAWMGLPEKEDHPTAKYGWIHTLTIPRVLELVGDKLYQKPIEELKSLRKNGIFYDNIIIKDEEIELENIQGDVLELLIEFEVEDAVEFGIKLRCSSDNKEKTILSYNRDFEKFHFNREKSGKGEGGIRSCSMQDRKTLKLNAFIDTSCIEVFINEGEEVFTGRIYPDSMSKGIKFFAKGGSVKINKLQKWDLQ